MMMTGALLLSALLTTSSFKGRHRPLPDDVISQMKKYSWKPRCPVPLEDLSYLELSHWGYDGAVKQGQLVVHRKVAQEVLDIFKALFEAKFPIEKMRLIDAYESSDDASMADNNTSAFNCRPIPDRPTVYSNHSYGLAIDVNPKINPYITSKGVVMPPEGARYLNRTEKHPGLIVENDVVVKAFRSKGWKWGGHWKGAKDYQHFDKKLSLNRKERKFSDGASPVTPSP